MHVKKTSQKNLLQYQNILFNSFPDNIIFYKGFKILYKNFYYAFFQWKKLVPVLILLGIASPKIAIREVLAPARITITSAILFLIRYLLSKEFQLPKTKNSFIITSHIAQLL